MDSPRRTDARPGARKQAGVALTSELVLLSTVSALGLIAGLVILRDGTTGELNDVAEAIGALNQSYTFHGTTVTHTDGDITGTTTVVGSAWEDGVDAGAGDGLAWTYPAAVADEAGLGAGGAGGEDGEDG